MKSKTSTRVHRIDTIVNWQESLQRLDGAYAEGTLRAYRTDIITFVDWCESSQLTPFPAAPETIAAFITHEAERCSVSTIKRRLAALVKIHRLLKMENSASDEIVSIAVRRILRQKSSRPHQAMGLTNALKFKLIENLPNSPIGIRDQALIAVGYDTLCRRSELVSLRIEDLTMTDDGHGKILIRRAKNDQLGIGRTSYLSEATIKLLKDWLQKAKIEKGPIFRPLNKKKLKSNSLHPYSVNRIIKRAAEKAGLPQKEIENLSGHSLRVGAAQDMMASGLDILPIMAAGGWKSVNIVARYVQETDLLNIFQKRNSLEKQAIIKKNN